MQELRALSFTERETSMALIEFSGRIKRKLPFGTVMDAVITPGPPIGVVLPIEDDHGEIKRIPFAETEVAAALVQYCMGRKVRLPVKGEKLLRIINGIPTLVIWLPEGAAAPAKSTMVRKPSRPSAG